MGRVIMREDIWVVAIDLNRVGWEFSKVNKKALNLESLIIKQVVPRKGLEPLLLHQETDFEDLASKITKKIEDLKSYKN